MIKCFGFLKSLKQLFIISLISFFGLLASSFVNAGVVYKSVGSYQVPGFSDYTQTIYSTTNGKVSKGNITNNYFMIPACPSVNTYGFVFRGTDKNLYIANVQNGNLSYIQRMDLGFITTPENSWNGFTPTYIPLYNSGLATIPTNTFANDLNYDNNLTRIAYYTYDNNCQSSYIGGICFIYDSLNESVCFSPNYKTSSYENISYIMSGGVVISPSVISGFNIGFSGVNYDNSSPWIGYFPSDPGKLNGGFYLNSGYTNSDMIEGFECVGLQSYLCYGGFDIDNIFSPSESFDDFTGYRAGQGATIFEIYNLYSGNFTSLNQFLNTVLTRYQNGQINSFKTEPKALLMLGAQMNTAGFKTSYISSYCNLLLNDNNDNLYTGNTFDDLRVQSCLKSKRVSSSLSSGVNEIGFQTINNGVFSGGDVDFDPDTFFSTIMDTIDKNLNQNLSGGMVGFLPGYIVGVFLALVFIRLITH